MTKPKQRAAARQRRQVAAYRTQAPVGDWGEGFVAEVAARTSVPRRRLRLALQAAEHLSDAELTVVERLARFAASGASAAHRRSVAEGLTRALESVALRPGVDPLAGVDAPINAPAIVKAVMQSDLEIQAHRRELLRSCLNAAAASARIGRSRQALERLRRQGRVLALRVGNQWRYPDWQFEPDAPGGVVPGLGEALSHLRLSPAGAALWLTQPSARLRGESPIDALRRHGREAVARLAIEHGHMP